MIRGGFKNLRLWIPVRHADPIGRRLERLYSCRAAGFRRCHSLKSSVGIGDRGQPLDRRCNFSSSTEPSAKL